MNVQLDMSRWREGLGIGILCTQCVHSYAKSEQRALQALLPFCPVCGFEELRGANALFWCEDPVQEACTITRSVRS